MTQIYVRRQEVVRVEVLTPELFAQLDPAFAKYASIGDYLVTPTTFPMDPQRIMTRAQLDGAYVHEGQDYLGKLGLEHVELDTLARENASAIEAIGKRVHDMDVILSKLTAEKADTQPAPEPKPESKAKSK